MKIGIDIDDTICYSIENMLPYICEYYNLNYDLEKEKHLGYDAYHGLPNYQEFATSTYEKVMPLAKVKEEAPYYINKLSECGYQIIFITARSEYGFSDAYLLSKEYLEKYNIHFDKLIVGARDKGLVCKNEKIDFFIDDNLKNCYDVQKEGINVFLFHNNFNREDKHFDRVYNWKEVYDKIKNQHNVD